MSRLLQYILLPREVTPFEETYLRRMNKIALAFFWLHPPAFVVVALLAGTRVSVAIVLSVAAMIGPTLAYVAFAAKPRVVSMVYGFTAMLMGGALVYVGQGPMQIEMHFYFFVLIALLSVFGNPMVVLVAAVTVAVHHLTVFVLMPSAVFNYDASVWAVVVHALFVVLESVAACFVARSFFDNLIGLEKIVTNRTRALDGRNRDMARILDNAAQGFVSVDLDGRMGAEWSRALTRWFGEPVAGAPLSAYVAADDPDLAAWFELSFESVRDGFMPIAVLIDQFPRQVTSGDLTLRMEYQPVDEPVTSILVVVSDVTEELARQRAESTQIELIAVVERAFRDRAGFGAFVHEAAELVQRCVAPSDEPLPVIKRRLHTLKGNTAMFGVTSIATACHEIEQWVEDHDAAPDDACRARLETAWHDFHSRITRILGATDRHALEVDWRDYQAVVAALPDPEPPWATKIRDWGKTPTKPRLEQFADYARVLAIRLGKPDIEVSIDDHDVRVPGDQLAGIWSALVHTIRNAIDHGIEPVERRLGADKPARGHVHIETKVANGELRIDVIDDGGGIDWAAVADRARTLGIPATTAVDLVDAVFASGLSTAAAVTETSGRGVGMGALRSACHDLGGRVELNSTPQGTRVTCVLPMRLLARRPRRTASPTIDPAAHN